jgi:nucleoside-diphosphate-sugar epimerase
MSQKSKYLVTGSNGFLGSTLVSHLRKLGNEVSLLGRGGQNDFIQDITKPFELPAGEYFDIIVHSAGKAHSIPGSKAEEQEFYDVNFEGTKNLCNALVNGGIKPAGFVFISSVAVYGLDEAEMVKEDAPLRGETPYAKSKIQAEQWLREWANAKGVKLAILRLPLVAGPNPPGNLGAMISGISNGRYLSIGRGAAKKSTVWSADIAEIIPEAAAKGGVFNLTDGYNPSFDELELGIARVLKIKKVKKIPYGLAKILALGGDLVGRRSPINSNKLKKITSTLTFDDSQARKVLNWQPTRVLDKLKDMI